MSTVYHADTIERIRKISIECGFSTKGIARRCGVSKATVLWWARRGWVSPDHRSMRDIAMERDRQRLRDAIVQCQGDVTAVARVLGVSAAHVKFGVRRASLQDVLASSLPARRCKICGAEFRHPEKRRKICSSECRAENKIKSARDRYERSRGADAHTPNTWERLAAQVRDALWRCWGNVSRAAALLGRTVKALREYIHRHELQPYVERCRARLRDPGELKALLEDHGWDHAAASASLGYRPDWVRIQARRIGAKEIAATRPCIECGRVHVCTGLARDRRLCSDACRRRRLARASRERHRAKRQRGDSCIRA